MLIKTKGEIDLMRKSGRILAEIIHQIKLAVRPGIETKFLDNLGRDLIAKYNVKPAFLGYGGFPGVVCLSVNEEIVHGVPSGRILREGDLLGIDMGVVYQGWYSDSAITVLVGDGSLAIDQKNNQGLMTNEKMKLINVTKQALDIGIKNTRNGAYIGDIANAIQSHVESYGFGVVRDLVGHGIGRKLHEEPHVPNFGKKGDGLKLKSGMVIAIEPMVTLGDWKVILDSDRFTYKTKDGSLSAHFEHTVAITDNGAEILTQI